MLGGTIQLYYDTTILPAAAWAEQPHDPGPARPGSLLLSPARNGTARFGPGQDRKGLTVSLGRTDSEAGGARLRLGPGTLHRACQSAAAAPRASESGWCKTP